MRTSSSKVKKKRKVLQAKLGHRIWMTRGLKEEHHAGLRKVASFMPRVVVEGKYTSGTIQAAHDLVVTLGLRAAYAQLGIPEEFEAEPPAA